MSDKEIVIDEVIQLEPDGETAKYDRAEYSTVVFHNIAETYPEDAHIECRYTVTSDLVPTTRDWVAIYKVGWMSPKDYLYYEWAPIPKDYRVGSDAEASVMFPAHKLPKDDGEFYQFCYVASSSQIRGASTPFQFRRPGADDYVEIEDDETNMLVIRSKTVFLEENLQKAEVKRLRLLEYQEALQKERDEIVTKYQELKQKLSAKDAETSSLLGKLQEKTSAEERMRKEAMDMNLLQEELQAKIDKLKKDKKSLEETITGLREEIQRLTRQVKDLQREKDELSGNNANLEEQVQLFKEHFSTSKATADKYSQQSEELQVQLATNESLIEHLKQEVANLKKELGASQQLLDKQLAITCQDQEKMAELEERLRNAEDKLMAAEESKKNMMEEMVSYDETQQKLSREIEKSKTENEGLKQKLCALEDDFTQKNRIQEGEMDQTRQDLLAAVQEKQALQEKLQELQSNLMSSQEMSDMNKDSMSIMQLTLTQIKERLSKKEKQCKSLERRLCTSEEKSIMRERDLTRELEDMKDKIYMCSEEYKKIFIEKRKLEKKLEKVSKKGKGKPQALESESEPNIEREMVLSSAASDVFSPDHESSFREMEKELEVMEKQMNKDLEKRLKYRELYEQEKGKVEELKSKHQQDLREKDEELDNLKKRIKDLPSIWDLKVRSLEKCVTEKEMIIEELNEKLRMSNQGRNDETGASTVQSRGIPTDDKPQYPMYSNMYPNQMATPPFSPQPGLWAYPHQRSDMAPQPPPAMPYPGMAVPVNYPMVPAVQYPGQVPVSPCPPQQPQEPEKYPVQRCGTLSQYDMQRQENILDKPEANTDELHAPLKPEVLPSAKMAAVKSKYCDEADSQLRDITSDTDLKVALPDAVAPAAPHGLEDRFYDAPGTAMKHCPECELTFSADVSDQIFEEHQLSHIVNICPVCKMMKGEDMTDEDFNRHVNRHLEDSQREGGQIY